MTNLKIGNYGVVRQLFAYTITRVPSTHLYRAVSSVGRHTCSLGEKGPTRSSISLLQSVFITDELSPYRLFLLKIKLDAFSRPLNLRELTPIPTSPQMTNRIFHFCSLKVHQGSVIFSNPPEKFDRLEVLTIVGRRPDKTSIATMMGVPLGLAFQEFWFVLLKIFDHFKPGTRTAVKAFRPAYGFLNSSMPPTIKGLPC